MLTVTDVQMRMFVDNLQRAAAWRVLAALRASEAALIDRIPRALHQQVALAAVRMAAEHGRSDDEDCLKLLVGLLRFAKDGTVPPDARPAALDRATTTDEA
jgi:hypothetical protein